MSHRVQTGARSARLIVDDQPEEVGTLAKTVSELDGEVVTKVSPRSVSETVYRLTEMLKEKRMKIFAVIDQSAEARAVGLELRATTLVMFGSPVAGTPVMAAVPLSALDLPLRALVWFDGKETNVSYLAPGALARRYGLGADLSERLAGIDALTDALVSA